MAKDWIKLGEGTFNVAYIDQQRQLVLKIQKNDGGQTDLPERSVRLWNEINAEISPVAKLASTPMGNGWVCPYVEGTQSSDFEMAHAVVNIYNRTGRIVIDATASRNFITTSKGNVVCIDIGMALQLQKDEEILMSGMRQRRKSIVSLKAWDNLQREYSSFFIQSEHFYPQTVNTVKSLLFIKSNRPDISDASFLFNKPRIVKELSYAYDTQQVYFGSEFWETRYALELIKASSPDLPQITQSEIEEKSDFEPMSNQIGQVEAQLQEVRPANLAQIKASCFVEIDRYIHSRGCVDIEGNFDAGWITKIFRNAQLTALKVQKAKNLKSKIDSSDTYEDIKENIDALLKDQDAVKSAFGSALEASLNRCLLIVASGKINDFEEQATLSSSEWHTIPLFK